MHLTVHSLSSVPDAVIEASLAKTRSAEATIVALVDMGISGSVSSEANPTPETAGVKEGGGAAGRKSRPGLNAGPAPEPGSFADRKAKMFDRYREAYIEKFGERLEGNTGRELDAVLRKSSKSPARANTAAF